jgi:hypothetical protein
VNFTWLSQMGRTKENHHPISPYLNSLLISFLSGKGPATHLLRISGQRARRTGDTVLSGSVSLIFTGFARSLDMAWNWSGGTRTAFAATLQEQFTLTKDSSQEEAYLNEKSLKLRTQLFCIVLKRLLCYRHSTEYRLRLHYREIMIQFNPINHINTFKL